MMAEQKKVPGIRGVKDVLPGEVEHWQWIEETSRRIFHRYGYGEIKIPIFERTELFSRGIGETTDIVEKEMYSFSDKGGESITLRPEATACIIRAYIEHHLYKKSPLSRLYVIGPMFRYERPQAGRLRQFHQIDAEAIGSLSPSIDAELILMVWELLHELRLEGLSLELNSLGERDSRASFRGALKSYFESKLNLLCQNCRRRFHTNPLRILDCKEPGCIEVVYRGPSIKDHLSPECREHLEEVRALLSELGVPHRINSRLVRGLDYYSRTIFEVTAEGLGAQNAVCGGGRYDALVEELGGPPTPAIGFALGIERLVVALSHQGALLKRERERELVIFFAAMGSRAEREAFRLIHALRKEGFRCEGDYREKKSLKSMLRRAGRLYASYAVILGDKEIDEGVALVRPMGLEPLVRPGGLPEHLVRDLQEVVQDRVPLKDLVAYFEKKVRGKPQEG